MISFQEHKYTELIYSQESLPACCGFLNIQYVESQAL